MTAVAILDADPDLAEGLGEAERAVAARHLLVPCVDLPVGPWNPDAIARHGAESLGVLVIEGVLSRSMTLAGRTTGELVGAGDVLRPWEADDALPPVPWELQWLALSPTRLALLDRRFMVAAARWPCVLEAVGHRTVRRSRALALQLALSQVPRVEGRLMLLLHRLAQRWGRVTPEGIVVPIRLTHELLAGLVAARRPSVTSALGRLHEAGLLQRTEGGWLLDRDAEERLPEFLAAQDGRVGARG